MHGSDTNLGKRRSEVISRVLFYVLAWAIICIVSGAIAQPLDQVAAEQTAERFWVAVDQDPLEGVYQSYTSRRFRERHPQQQFVQEMDKLRILGGGRAQARVLVVSQEIVPGMLYFVRYKAQYPNRFIFQDVSLEEDNTVLRVLSLEVSW